MVSPLILLNTSSGLSVCLCAADKSRQESARVHEREAQVSSWESGVEFAISVAMETKANNVSFKGLLAQTKVLSGSSYHMLPTEGNAVGKHKSMHTLFFNHEST